MPIAPGEALHSALHSELTQPPLPLFFSFHSGFPAVSIRGAPEGCGAVSNTVSSPGVGEARCGRIEYVVERPEGAGLW